MKRIFAFFIILLLAIFSVVSVGATELESITETDAIETLPEETSPVVELDSEEASEVVEIIEENDNKTEAIVALAEKLGISLDAAENIINSMIEVGDEYLGENQYWLAFKTDIQEDMQFWTTAIVLIVAVIAIIGAIFVLLGKTNPGMQKLTYIAEESVAAIKSDAKANSQTLEEIKKAVADSIAREDGYKQIIAEKDDKIIELAAKIEALETAEQSERKNMLCAELYNLQALKLTLSRTNLPLTDKSAIELWFTKAEESLKSEMNKTDVESVEKMAEILPEDNNEKTV